MFLGVVEFAVRELVVLHVVGLAVPVRVTALAVPPARASRGIRHRDWVEIQPRAPRSGAVARRPAVVIERVADVNLRATAATATARLFHNMLLAQRLHGRRLHRLLVVRVALSLFLRFSFILAAVAARDASRATSALAFDPLLRGVGGKHTTAIIVL